MDQPQGPLDARIASPARVYDYLLGGKNNFAVDRAAGDTMLQIEPYASTVALDNRAFLTRAVRYLAARGVDQFLDIGTGLPTQNPVHEVAQQAGTDPRVVYVDNDPMVITHAGALLAAHTDTVDIVPGDLYEPDAILDHPKTLRLIDYDRPVALLLVAILHFVPDQADPYALVTRYLSRLAPGSYLVLSHGSSDRNPAATDVTKNYHARAPLIARTHAQITRFFTGLDLIPPGLTWTFKWNPHQPADDLSDQRHIVYAGVGRKP